MKDNKNDDLVSNCMYTDLTLMARYRKTCIEVAEKHTRSQSTIQLTYVTKLTPHQ